MQFVNSFYVKDFCRFLSGGGHYQVEMSITDQELLREYAEQDSQAAFKELVGRHLGLVYSAARRQVGDAQLAEDVSQQVFSLLAQKAARLKPRVVVAGWLYRASRQVSSEFIRRESRRHRRERAAMETMDNASGRECHELGPWLEEAMTSLGQKDHDAVVLRYFENRTLKEVGVALGLTEDAAQKRLIRAIEKLRMFFNRRGKAISATALTAALVGGAIQPVPGALAATIPGAALSAAAASGAASGLIQTLTFMNTKTLLTGAAVLTAVLVPLTLRQSTASEWQVGQDVYVRRWSDTADALR
jgi:RNA polymerase sigma factor (sigma-70 family)